MRAEFNNMLPLASITQETTLAKQGAAAAAMGKCTHLLLRQHRHLFLTL